MGGDLNPHWEVTLRLELVDLGFAQPCNSEDLPEAQESNWRGVLRDTICGE
jgi:hypothetical protein